MRPECHMTFDVKAIDGQARRGQITFPRGTIQTPAFMPVGTYGTVKAVTTDQVSDSGAEILLGNTFHLMLRPGAERVSNLGGVRNMMGWQGPLLTDSGGFQVMFAMPRNCRNSPVRGEPNTSSGAPAS